MNKPLWIWYPGDFEKWLQEQVLMRRDFRRVIQPPFWRLDSCYHKIRFSCPYSSASAQKVTIHTSAEIAAGVLGIANVIEPNEDGTYTLPPGKGRFFVDTYQPEGLPAILVEGGLVSGRGWDASVTEHPEVPAGCYQTFDDPSSPPTAFALRQVPMPYRSVKDAEGIFRGKKVKGRLFDFGKETFGLLSFRNVSGNGRLYAFYGESMEEALAPDHCETFDLCEVNGSAASMPVSRTRAFRYVFILEDGVGFEDLAYAYEYLPLRYRGTFKSSDEKLNRIWETALYTLHLNTREFFLDGLKRDRWIWGGDAYQSALMNYYSFFDRDICKRTLYALCPKPPIERHINHIPDYTFYWFATLYDYYYFTGDLDFITEIYDRAKALLSFSLSRSEDNLFVYAKEGDWIFVDWADMEKDGALSVEQILFVHALKVMGIMAGLTGHTEDEGTYTTMAGRLMQAVEATFWDEGKGAFIHSIGDYGRCETVTRYANMFALMYDLVDSDKKDSIAVNVIKNPAVQEVGTPYARFYELDAIGTVGDKDYILREIRSYWGGMLDLGATSFWEKFSYDETDHYEMYDRPFGKSLCHAWGASPVYLLGKYFLGVTPAEAGYASFTACPYLGDLSFIEGSVPTPGGNVSIRMDRAAITVTAENIPGHVLVRSKATPSAAGAEIEDLGGNLYSVAVTPAVPCKISYTPV